MTKVFQVEARTKTGTGAARAVRRSDMVPGIVYGNKKESTMLSMPIKDIVMEFTSRRFFATVYELDFGKKKIEAIVKAVQKHPVTDRPMHIDFMLVDKNSLITVAIPVKFLNEDKAPAIKRGGILNIILHELEVICSPHKIPASIDVDLAGIEANKSILLTELKLPDGAKAAHARRDQVMATIVTPASDKDEEAAA